MSLTTEAPPHEAQSKAAAKVARVAGTTEARIAEDDAKSARRLRERQAAVELRLKEIEVRRAERDAKAAAREAKRTSRAQRRRTKRQARIDRATAAYTRAYLFVAGNMPGVYSACIYAMALYVAVYGQITMATERGWPVVFGIGMAVFLEGLALSMALTAHQLRLKGERALVPAAMTWVAAGFASGINFFAHRDDLIMAAVLGASSLAAIIVWEVRSGAKHRDALRKLGLIPDPPERFGLRRWVRYPRSTWRAWSLDVRDRVGDGAAALLARVEADVQTVAAAASAATAQAAQQAALDSATAAAEQAARAQNAAADAVKAAKRTAPKRRFTLWGKAAEKAPAAQTTTPRIAAGATPKVKTSKTTTPTEPAPRTVPADFSEVEKAFVQLYVDTGKRPSSRALEQAVGGIKKKSAIHTWTQTYAGRIAELIESAEAVRSGQESTA